MALALHEPTSPLGDLLIEAEESRGLGAGDAAAACGVARSTYLYWKRGTHPKIKHLPIISAFCKQPPRVILEAIGLEVDTTYQSDGIPGYLHSRGDNVDADRILKLVS